MKRDLIKFIPLLNRRTRRKTRELEQSELNNMSWDYAKTYDHMVPTISFKNKWNDLNQKSIMDFKQRAFTSQSTERIGTAQSLIQKEEHNYLAEKLVYPSVKKLKNYMANFEGSSVKETKTLKKFCLII